MVVSFFIEKFIDTNWWFAAVVVVVQYPKNRIRWLRLLWNRKQKLHIFAAKCSIFGLALCSLELVRQYFAIQVLRFQFWFILFLNAVIIILSCMAAFKSRTHNSLRIRIKHFFAIDCMNNYYWYLILHIKSIIYSQKKWVNKHLMRDFNSNLYNWKSKVISRTEIEIGCWKYFPLLMALNNRLVFFF